MTGADVGVLASAVTEPTGSLREHPWLAAPGESPPTWGGDTVGTVGTAGAGGRDL